MKFKSFQKYNRKILIWSGATALFITLIVLLILLAIPLSTPRVKLMIGTQVVINELLIWALLWLGNRSRAFLRYLIQVNVYRHKRQIHHVNLSLHQNVYLWLLIFLAILWLIETSSFAFWTKSWSSAITSYWWVTFIFFGINYCYLLIFWNSQIYLYNHDSRILTALRETNS